jgi:hypothetical protein
LSDHTLGDEPIEPHYIHDMQAVAGALDKIFNPEVTANGHRGTGFVLLVFPYNSKDGRCNYISNGADRADIVRLFEEQIENFKGLG